MNKYNKFLGQIGENVACEYLKRRGYKILQRNFSCKNGEIDIITYKDKKIIFIEVKTRTNLNYGRPIEAIDKDKKTHIYNTAKYFLYKNNCLDKEIRFDAIEVIIKNKQVFINQIKQIL